MKLKFIFTLMLAMTISASLMAIDIDLKLSGKGVVNDSTVKAGEPFSVDVIITNDGNFKGFSFGFKLLSNDIESITHPADSGKGLNKNGDVKGYAEFADRSLFDLGGVYAVEKNWDGKFPELLGFGGISTKTFYEPHEAAKKLSFDLLINEEGQFLIDSSFFPPSGKWLFVPPESPPVWRGPYLFHVVK